MLHDNFADKSVRWGRLFSDLTKYTHYNIFEKCYVLEKEIFVFTFLKTIKLRMSLHSLRGKKMRLTRDRQVSVLMTRLIVALLYGTGCLKFNVKKIKIWIPCEEIG